MRRSRRILLGISLSGLVLMVSALSFCHARGRGPSACFGTTRSGALRDAWQLPASGDNFSVYSHLGWALGRTYVHSSVHTAVLEAYADLHADLPQRHFVYGETGWARGGRFRPHRTHQNGLSVDFMVPVLRADGTPGRLPTSALDKFGYGIDFDASGKNATLSIDFEALAAHLAKLQAAATRHHVRISQVILAPDLQAHLRQTRNWQAIRRMPFLKRPSWVRHDDHYHVDFDVPCKALSAADQATPLVVEG